MLIIRGGINSKKRELCPTALALSAFYYNKNKHADTYIMYLHAYSTSLARQTASQSSDQTAQSETRWLPAFKTRRQTPQTVVCAVRFCSSVCQARHKSRRKCPPVREHPWRTVEPQKDRNHH